ncbi:MAG: hypothetical protein RML15_08695 [Bacteroidota bacterium]|nr:hypothetical protein [Candidatus Kapabacteria bacterium]MCS7302924.1 hypothetical protein [Candidatus Kapabacteria bacterium]MDW8272468.1 hypothetical protein [Bacteroidota bacterium]
MPLIRSVSGLRATTTDGALSEEVVARHVRAFELLQGEGAVAVGHDGRQGSAAIAEQVCSVLCAAGRTVIELGCVPTPTVALVVERNRLAGGVVVTASHNGAEWNGLKFLDADGTFLAPSRIAELWALADRNVFSAYAQKGSVVRHTDPIGEHLAALEAVPLIAELRRSGKCSSMRIVIDAVNASGSHALPFLVEWLGATPIRLFCDGSGIFPHPPEPLPEHLEALTSATATAGATLGVAVDPDADRLVLVHERGQPISEEKTIVLAVEALLRKQPGGTVVVNASTTAEVEHVAARYQGRVLRSAVGEANVVALMRACNAAIGGEGSGGVILPACHYGRDSLVGTALILALRGALSSHEWDARTLQSPFAMEKRKRSWQGDFATLRAALLRELSNGAQIWEGDGLRLQWQDQWLHVRPSNTEPIVRLIAESPTAEQTAALLDRAEQILATFAA